MGLKAFKGKMPTKQEIGVAKNYLSEEELAVLNRLWFLPIWTLQKSTPCNANPCT
jgi:hypothetical protein